MVMVMVRALILFFGLRQEAIEKTEDREAVGEEVGGVQRASSELSSHG